MIDEEILALCARADDLCEAAERGSVGISNFLSPREQHFFIKHLSRRGMQDRCFFYGGYESAERKRAFVLPEYLCGSVSSYDELSCFIEHKCIVVISVSGSGYRKLTHRDFLGSVLGLGVERSSVGDITLDDPEAQGALVFCDGVIGDFILNELKKVGSDSVKIKLVDIPKDYQPQRNFSHISDTVASARLDCVVAALCSLSRDKALKAVVSGLVEVDFEREERPDKLLGAPCTLSVRGHGRFRVNSVCDLTKKGRLRLDADKYI